MTWICVIGIELNAATQRWLLSRRDPHAGAVRRRRAVKVARHRRPDRGRPSSLEWLNPFDISSFNALIDGVLLGIFIYWGWDSGVAVNEESEDSPRRPGQRGRR